MINKYDYQEYFFKPKKYIENTNYIFSVSFREEIGNPEDDNEPYDKIEFPLDINFII